MSSGIPSVTLAEARGNIAPPPPIDSSSVVAGCSSMGTPGTLNGPYANVAAMTAAVGIGPGPTAAAYVIDQYGIPVYLYKTPSTTAGSYDALALGGFTGTAVPAAGATTPLEGFTAYVLFTAGTTALGTAGAYYKTALDWGNGSGPTLSAAKALGTGSTISIPIADGVTASGAQIVLNTAVVGTTDATASGLYGGGGSLNAETLILTQPGGSPLTLTLSGAGNTATQAAFLAAIHTEWPGITATIVATHLVLTAAGGPIVVGAGTANTNLGLTAATSAGTINAGDIIQVLCHGPTWADADLDAAASLTTTPKGPLVTTTYDFAHLYVAGACASTDAGHVTTILNNLRTAGKLVDAVVHTRGPNVASSESEATWAAAIEADYSAFGDDRIEVIEGMPALVVDPTTSQIWKRSWAYAYFGRMVAAERSTWVGCPNDGGFTDPNDGAQLVLLYDTNGNLIGHDEGPSGNITGLSDAQGSGNRFTCIMRGQTNSTRKFAYTTVPWVQWTPGGRIFLMGARRVAQTMERDALDVSFAQLGGTAFYDTDPLTQISTLTVEAQNAIHHVLFSSLTGDKYATDIENSADDDPSTGLVQVNPVVTVAPGNLMTLAVELAPKIAGKVLSIGLTYAAQ